MTRPDALRDRPGVDDVRIRAGAGATSFHGLVGKSPALERLFASIERFAPHARVALITGEAGTGRSLLAWTLHRLGPCRDGRFAEVRCGPTMDTSALESILGAGPDAASDGTIFFDEVAELPKGLQASLLGVLASGEGRDAGERRPTVHVIAATARDLQAEVARGSFRPDLLYRLNAIELYLPPLRERREDIEVLSALFLHEIAHRLGRPTAGLTTSAIHLLRAWPWPGNLRELRNVLERACILNDDDVLGERAIRAALVSASASTKNEAKSDDLPGAQFDRLDEAQRAHLHAVLHRMHGNKAQAARHLGVSRRALYRLLDRPRT